MAYPTTPLKSFTDVQKLLDAFHKWAQFPIGSAPHGMFWRTNIITGAPMTWQDFTTGVLPLKPPNDVNFQDPAGDANTPLILEVGNATGSVIINMLTGMGTYWDDVGNIAGQMPQDNPPYNSGDPPQTLVVQLLSDWINKGCPNGIHSLVRSKEA
jgi:hypothetical protein